MEKYFVVDSETNNRSYVSYAMHIFSLRSWDKTIKVKLFNIVSKSAQTAEEEINKFMTEIQKQSKITSVQVNSWVAVGLKMQDMWFKIRREKAFRDSQAGAW
jgi:predicted metal-dependent peptidase